MVGRFAGLRCLAVLVALACSLLVTASDAWAGSPKNYTPAVVAGVFRGVGIELYVYTVSGHGPDAYMWLRPRTRCSDTSNPACVAQIIKARRLVVAVCPSAHTAARVASGTAKTWQTTTIRNVVVAYQTTFEQRPANVGLAISRLSGTRAA